ncbi:MAG TPA: bifunctional transaldolase/phosoglucose isomerase [Acetobacteraceae bacterium]
MNPLKQLEACGQSPWLDFVRRDLIDKGELKTLVERDGVKGVTSNPAIFEKAIGAGAEYAAPFAAFMGDGDHGVSTIYEHLAIHDIRGAAAVLKPVFEAAHGADGFISLEVSPYLANDTQATIGEARRLWKTVDRPNLMVKVPATPAGIPAIQTLIGDGLNINVTLLFAVSAYDAVAEAYIAGLEKLAENGGNVSRTASVASFFVSRIDALVDKKLDAAVAGGADKAKADALRGAAAIANAKLAYALYKKKFSGPRWDKLAAKGARPQRLLWASTSTKNPTYCDTLYVEALIGRDTVNTMPPVTMDAFRDHGVAKANTVEEGLDQAQKIAPALKALGVDMEKVAAELVVDGVQQFADAFDKLLGAVAGRRRELLGKKLGSQHLGLGAALQKAYDAEIEGWRHDGRIRKLWHGDKTLWTGADEDKWLGWLTIAGEELADIAKLEALVADIRKYKITDVVLLGMGGSSLGPEVLAETFGQIAGAPKFHMLDSTDPAQIRALDKVVPLRSSLFIVSSKSGSTLEPSIFMAHFYEALSKEIGADKAGAQFVAVTDPGSALEKEAAEKKFAHVFLGKKSIGGRYSVLSKFGLVPAAAIGIDVKALLETTLRMVRSCGEDIPPPENPGLQLGVAMGVAAKQGRDKVTILTSPGIAGLGAWLEQLLAESTGKQGHGLIPVDAESVGKPENYGTDRFFAYLVRDGHEDATQTKAVAALEAAGHPVVRIAVPDATHIGAEFFRWEIAVAVAGAVIGINPFDQPDVEASKIATRHLTDEYEKTGKLPQEKPVFQANGISIFADEANAAALGKQNSVEAYLRSHLARVGAGDYVALLAYIQRDKGHTETLTQTRVAVRDHTHAATCVGFGPRFLHSTGQAYKGGPNSGVFVQITSDDAEDLPVPGRSYSFGTVKAAQAQGDLAVLYERKRRAMRIHLKDPSAGLDDIKRAVVQALA